MSNTPNLTHEGYVNYGEETQDYAPAYAQDGEYWDEQYGYNEEDDAQDYECATDGFGMGNYYFPEKSVEEPKAGMPYFKRRSESLRWAR
ncbi:hypothetical protein PFISCL1PPCAC_27888, partial [Pristionchus fissidentatus]